MGMKPTIQMNNFTTNVRIPKKDLKSGKRTLKLPAANIFEYYAEEKPVPVLKPGQLSASHHWVPPPPYSWIPQMDQVRTWVARNVRTAE